MLQCLLSTVKIVKAALLRFSKYFVRFLTPAEVKDFILPLVPLCLNSRNLETLTAAMEALPKLVEYPISSETYEKCLNKAINAFKKSASRPQVQSVAIQCVANILSQLPLDVIENVLLPFALEATAEAANNAGTVRVSGGNGGRSCIQGDSASAARDIPGLIPGYLIEFDFFLSEGEPFKYVMSTLYEYLNFLNEANPSPLAQESSQSNNQKDTKRNCDQAIKVCIDRGIKVAQ
ncbi:hypothetical protein ACTXT7_004871 [Hymenolepis weldensis]